MAASSLSDAIGLDSRDVVAFVGGGGKTTALRILGAECAAGGEPVVLTTTTKIEPQRGIRTVFVGLSFSSTDCGPPWPLLAVTENLGSRLRGVSDAWIRKAKAAGLRVLAQADGSGHRPFKAPAAHEPVIPTSATLVVSVVGIDCIGAPLDDEHVHRASRVAELSQHAPGAPVTEETVVRVLGHPDGGGKGVPPGARRVVLINKVESDEDREAAGRIADGLKARGLRAIVASLRRRELRVA